MRLTLAPGDDLVALVRAVPAGESVTILIEPGREPLTFALARAALTPLAVERAPARVNAVAAAPDADDADRAAAVAWLDRAESTTGQWIEVSAPASARTGPANR